MGVPEWQSVPADDDTIEEDIDDAADADDRALIDAGNKRYSVSYYGVDFDVAGLVKRLDNEDIYIPAFQRQFVWTTAQASRFVESLLLGLPVPGVFLYRDEATRKMIFVDGLQRLSTMKAFMSGLLREREFKLRGVLPEFEGRTYRMLAPADRRQFDDSYIHATVIKQDEPAEDDPSSLYHVFERLNTGGTPLSPQEIRACLNMGPLNDLLARLVQSEPWRELYGRPSRRGKDDELVLRFFALYHDLDSYGKPMRSFLNDFMGKHRHLGELTGADLSLLFETSVQAVLRHLGKQAVRPVRNLNAALMDAVLVGTAKRLERGPITDTAGFRAIHHELLSDSGFAELYERQTTDVDRVRGRIQRYAEALEGVS